MQEGRLEEGYWHVHGFDICVGSFRYNLHPRLTLLIVVIESFLEYIVTLNQLTMDHEWSNKKTHEYLVFK